MNATDLEKLSSLIANNTTVKSYKAVIKHNFVSEINVAVYSEWVIVRDLNLIISRIKVNSAEHIQIYSSTGTAAEWVNDEDADKTVDITSDLIMKCVNHCKQQYQVVQEVNQLISEEKSE